MSKFFTCRHLIESSQSNVSDSPLPPPTIPTHSPRHRVYRNRLPPKIYKMCKNEWLHCKIKEDQFLYIFFKFLYFYMVLVFFFLFFLFWVSEIYLGQQWMYMRLHLKYIDQISIRKLTHAQCFIKWRRDWNHSHKM